MLLQNAAIFTDLYQLTMMQGYWARQRLHENAAFELFFRATPEHGGYCIAAGIEDALANVLAARFTPEHLEDLRALNLFQHGFLDYLRTLRFTGNVRTLAEGTLVFPNEPILEVTAPIAEAQWMETLLLNLVNFSTLIATKASRIVQTAAPAKVMEFGLRRAQGPNGALTVSWAAYLAGCVSTSNVEAGLLFGIPLSGTHAHSWIMSFASEEEAFRAYTEVFPDKSILLIDTYDTVGQGLPKAIAEAKHLASQGRRLVGVRIDSGDLAYLAKICRKQFDDAGFPDVQIVASSDIDEYLIQDLKVQNAPIDVYGVGTRLATAFGEPALGGVYKLVALERGGDWQPRIKLSSNPIKTTIPGRKQIWRWEVDGQYLGDALAIAGEPAPNRMRHPNVEFKQTPLPPEQLRPLLELRIRNGEPFGSPTDLAAGRLRVATQLKALPAEHQRLANPHIYRIGLSPALWQLRRDMIERASAD